MAYFNNILEAIGSTPLVKLNKVTSSEGATVLVKCEHLNPTGSIKDRMALHIIEQAEKLGLLKSGGTIVENTSGNTGLGVAMVAAVKGYRCVFTMPDKMSIEKVNMLKAFGAEVVITPTNVPGNSPQHYVEVAKRIARETPHAFYVDQYHNKLNTEAHYLTTGREVWEQTAGKLDVFISGTGTGGTTSGAGKYIKEKSKKVRIVGVDPYGSVHYELFKHGKIITPPHVYKVEGIGEDIPCQAMDYSVVDEMYQVSDDQCFIMARKLVRDEGIFCGGSSGGIVDVAVKLAADMTPDKIIVAILPDSATRYISKYLSDTWMIDNGFMPKSYGLGSVADLLKTKGAEVITVCDADPVGSAFKLLKQHGISQLPVLDEHGKLSGIVHEIDILRGLTARTISMDSQVKIAATAVVATIAADDSLSKLYEIFERDHAAIVVENQKIKGILTEIDVIEYISRRANGH